MCVADVECMWLNFYYNPTINILDLFGCRKLCVGSPKFVQCGLIYLFSVIQLVTQCKLFACLGICVGLHARYRIFSYFLVTYLLKR